MNLYKNPAAASTGEVRDNLYKNPITIGKLRPVKYIHGFKWVEEYIYGEAWVNLYKNPNKPSKLWRGMGQPL